MNGVRTRAALLAALLLALLFLLATRGAHWGLLRTFGGDVFAVVCLYALLAVVWPRTSGTRLALAALAIGVLVEAAQWVAATMHWRFGNRALRIVLGSTPDVWDVVAYALGAALAWLVVAPLIGQKR